MLSKARPLSIVAEGDTPPLRKPARRLPLAATPLSVSNTAGWPWPRNAASRQSTQCTTCMPFNSLIYIKSGYSPLRTGASSYLFNSKTDWGDRTCIVTRVSLDFTQNSMGWVSRKASSCVMAAKLTDSVRPAMGSCSPLTSMACTCAARLVRATLWQGAPAWQRRSCRQLRRRQQLRIEKVAHWSGTPQVKTEAQVRFNTPSNNDSHGTSVQRCGHESARAARPGPAPHLRPPLDR
jgi:hypothetical protein